MVLWQRPVNASSHCVQRRCDDVRHEVAVIINSAAERRRHCAPYPVHRVGQAEKSSEHLFRARSLQHVQVAEASHCPEETNNDRRVEIWQPPKPEEDKVEDHDARTERGENACLLVPQLLDKKRHQRRPKQAEGSGGHEIIAQLHLRESEMVLEENRPRSIADAKCERVHYRQREQRQRPTVRDNKFYRILGIRSVFASRGLSVFMWNRFGNEVFPKQPSQQEVHDVDANEAIAQVWEAEGSKTPCDDRACQGATAADDFLCGKHMVELGVVFDEIHDVCHLDWAAAHSHADETTRQDEHLHCSSG
mmetsp:Transcript_88303/g.248672  ORF Transcript_88303/g.248672 Transcript_88303/m.248672 type:complete len:306 (-) Transcript_88303:337-1254(-)